jgi:hypothetical protein
VGASNWQVCNGATKIADSWGQLNLVIDDHGIVQRINVTFFSGGFERVKDAALTKFGSTALQKHVTDQNRMGATFDDELLLWKDSKDDEILLKHYVGDLDHSLLSFTTKAVRQATINAEKGKSGDL